MPEMHHHHTHLLLMAYRSAQRAVEDAQRPDALTDDSLTAIILAAVAAEAFINELAEDVLLTREARADWMPVDPRLVACAEAVVAVERDRGSTVQKFTAAGEALEKPFEIGRSPCQPFCDLFKLRDSIMHLRPSNVAGRKMADALAQRRIALSAEDSCNLHWLDRLQTPETAIWAATTARMMMLAVLERAPVPQGVDPSFDPLHVIKHLLCEHPGFKPVGSATGMVPSRIQSLTKPSWPG